MVSAIYKRNTGTFSLSLSAYGGLDCMPIVTVYRTVISCGTYSLEEAFEFCCHSFTEELE